MIPFAWLLRWFGGQPVEPITGSVIYSPALYGSAECSQTGTITTNLTTSTLAKQPYRATITGQGKTGTI